MDIATRIMAWAVPAFFVAILVEMAIAIWRSRGEYRINDSINSLALGALSQIAGVFTKLLSIGIYAWCFAHLALFELDPRSAWVWIVGLVLYDFLYYWYHRMGHEVRVLWAAHVVHHQSEYYNLTTALRQTSAGALLGWVFYLPMAVLGFPVEVFAAVAVIDLVYQFWVHTEQVGKLGWFDRVFCSPSNHRVHHAANDRYLDRNYGGILIVWDRLFGTFLEEDENEPPVYGTRSPLRSWNPLWANAEVYWGILRDAAQARRWRDKLLVWVRGPGWRPADVAARDPKPPFDIRRPRFDPPATTAQSAYVLAKFILLVAASELFLQDAAHSGLAALLPQALYLAGGLVLLGWLLEGRRFAAWLESACLLSTAALVLSTRQWFGHAIGSGTAIAIVAVSVLGALACLWLFVRDERGLRTQAQVS